MAERDENGRWLKGQSANPTGRRATVDRLLADGFRDPDKLKQRFEELEEICKAKAHPDQFAAIKLWLAYALGQPQAKLTFESEGGGPAVAILAGPNAVELAKIGAILAAAGALSGDRGEGETAHGGGGEADGTAAGAVVEALPAPD